ncbi:hypothetical protein EK21DRAFT_73997 [Setomelanomma holmii]|uniref:Uncharacterized protein n=1 Tax=Setomelanomma holmii TaxID=210430 RepID=A0A9P4H2N0_9PLEO|nr:hypothetical protein EK21DRAFT_73997 [Setomelanomma holmii]
MVDLSTARERIRALAEHEQVFEATAEFPPAGIHERFGGEWTMAIAYIEGQVHQSANAARLAIWKNSHAQAGDANADFVSAEELTASIDRAVKASKQMALAPPPSKLGLEAYRAYSGIDHGGRRAANGQLLSRYGGERDPVPSYLAAIDNEDLAPVAQIMTDWVMNPFAEYFIAPLRRGMIKTPFLRNLLRNQDPCVRAVGGNVMEALSKHVVIATAVLCLTAAVITLDAVKSQRLKIMTVALFALVFALPAQYMGSRSLPLFTLITT